MPFVWWVSRICEEFHCLPSQAIEEMRTVPEGLLSDIVEARAFAATWRHYRDAKNKSDVPPSPMLDVVQEIEMQVQYDLLQQRGALPTP